MVMYCIDWSAYQISVCSRKWKKKVPKAWCGWQDSIDIMVAPVGQQWLESAKY